MGNRVVMIVDDEPGLLALFGGLIKRLNCEVVEVDSGATAIELLQTQTPDVLVLDLAMPEVSGGDVLAYIKETPHLTSMRIIVLTALGIGMVRDELPDIVDRWVNKPVRPNQFLDIVQEVFGTGED